MIFFSSGVSFIHHLFSLSALLVDGRSRGKFQSWNIVWSSRVNGDVNRRSFRERERESLWPEAVCVLWPSRLSSLRKLMIMTETGSLISARPQRVFSFRFLIYLSFPNQQINRKFFKMKTWQRLEFIINLILHVWEKTRWCFDHLRMFWTPPSLCADLHWQRTYSYVISTCVRTYIWSHSVVPTGRLGVP